MEPILMEKLRAYITEHNPDLLLKLQGHFTVTQFLEDKVASVMQTVKGLRSEGKPAYVIQELCMNEMTADLRPSKFDYLKMVLEEDFPDDYRRITEAGVLTYEVVNIIEACADVFETHGFTEENEDNRFLRYAVIAEIHDYLT